MRVLISLIISLSIALGLLADASAANSGAEENSLQARTAKRAFLNDLRERVQMFMDQNVAYLTGLKLCFEGRPPLINCEESVRVVRNNIKVLYPKMRKQLLLISLLDPVTHGILMENFQNDVIGQLHGDGQPISIGVKNLLGANPIESIWDYDYIPQTPFTDKEVEDALSGDSVTIEETLYPENLSGYERYYCENVYGENHANCESMKLEYNKNKKSLQWARLPLTPEWSGRGTNRFSQFRNMMLQTHSLQVKAKATAKRKFFEIIQENPYVALMPSSQPSDREILLALKLMLEKAHKALNEYEKRMVKLSAPDAPEEDLVRLLEYSPVALSVIEEPGQNMSLMNYDYNSLFEEVNAEYMHNELMRMGGHIALLIGANALVCWSGGRAVKYLATAKKVIKLKRWHEFFNPLCFSFTTIPVNGWFIYDSMDFYHQTYKEVFSSADGVHFIREVNALEAAQRGVFWSIMLAPIGVGYFSKYAAIEGLGLSKEFIAHLSRLGRLK